MKTIAVRTISRAPQPVIDRLAAAGVATVHEAMGRSGLMKPHIRPIQEGKSIAGSAITVLAQPGDNWMIHVGVELALPRDILVVGVTADNTDGMFGDLLATSAMARGIAGLVIDAGCRDVKILRDMAFPVWARAISARGTVKETPGAVNVPIVCAGETVQPGDVIVADDDGVVIVPRAEAEAVAIAAELRIAKEETYRQRFAAGELSLDVADLRGKLAERGFAYVDSAAMIDTTDE